MTLVSVAPELVEALAAQAAGVGAAVDGATADVETATTGLLAAGGDEVSAAIAALFSGHGRAYQVVSGQAAAFHARFVQALVAGAESYAAAEAANVSPLQAAAQGVQAAINGPVQALTGRPLFGNGADGAAGTGQNGGAGGWLFGNGGAGGSGRRGKTVGPVGRRRCGEPAGPGVLVGPGRAAAPVVVRGGCSVPVVPVGPAERVRRAGPAVMRGGCGGLVVRVGPAESVGAPAVRAAAPGGSGPAAPAVLAVPVRRGPRAPCPALMALPGIQGWPVVMGATDRRAGQAGPAARAGLVVVGVDCSGTAGPAGPAVSAGSAEPGRPAGSAGTAVRACSSARWAAGTAEPAGPAGPAETAVTAGTAEPEAPVGPVGCSDTPEPAVAGV
ncbi:hypothetical protein MBOU_38470 [Mycobacterium bourgelatii]|uniref:PE domain-containing protein n=1 Tax=Mycobacterium bourgelatii TaxID=1273442 RepID=A0A7I9YT43_MYCBU|nr:hypothetical protein MBOU_38470 [Mycobacterium bourgelatii]